MKVHVHRIWADAGGETHFADDEMELAAGDFAPPAAPVLLSAWVAASQYALVAFPQGWLGEWHPAPARQVHFFLSGEGLVEVSDGGQRPYRAGDVWLVEDVTGKGHRTTAHTDSLSVVVRLDA